MGEMVEQISAASQSLCQVMGLPQRESCPAKATSADDDQLSSTASSAGAALHWHTHVVVQTPQMRCTYT